MSTKYIIIIDCDDPNQSRVLTNTRGETEVFEIKSDANETLKRITNSHGKEYARLVAI